MRIQVSEELSLPETTADIEAGDYVSNGLCMGIVVERRTVGSKGCHIPGFIIDVKFPDHSKQRGTSLDFIGESETRIMGWGR